MFFPSTQATTWTKLNFLVTVSKLDFFGRFDRNGRAFIKVNSVEKDVCKQLLLMNFTDKLTFYDELGLNKLSKCASLNDMVFSFESNGAMLCSNTSDCGTDFNGYCDSNGNCQECGKNAIVNQEKTRCNCDFSVTSCENSQGDTWCCDNDKICANIVNKCADITCSYQFFIKEKSSNCSYVSSYNEAKPTCSITFTESEGKIDSFESKKCLNSSDYCYINYSQNSCSSDAVLTSTDFTGTFYGSCVNKNVADSTCYPSIRLFENMNNCLDTEYCYINYLDNTCSTTLVDFIKTATVYGTCVPKTVADSTCYPNSSFKESEKCPSKYYCSLNWMNKNCSETPSELIDSTIDGVCLEKRRAVQTTDCPY